MNTYLNEFLAYFMPGIELPAWMQVFVGLICLTFFFKFILAILGLFNGRR